MDVLTTNDVKQIVTTDSGPCITLVLPTHSAQSDQRRQDPTRVKNVLKELERLAGERGLEPEAAKELLQPVREFLEGDALTRDDGQAVLVLRSPDTFYTVALPDMPEAERVEMAQYFYVKPLVKLADKQEEFYILALSRKRVRLIKCTPDSSEEVALPDDFPTGMMEALAIDTPDRNERGHSGTGHTSGEHSATSFSKGSEDANLKEYLHTFYTQVGKRLHDFLNSDARPIIAACVDYEWAIFRQGTASLPTLLEEHVSGSPDGLKGGELHSRALEVLAHRREQHIDQILQQYDKAYGGGQASNSIRDIVRAAHQGRVLHLLMAEGAELPGQFDEATYSVKPGSGRGDGGQDLVNVAALFTLLNRGEVHVVPADKLPNSAPMIAVYRY